MLINLGEVSESSTHLDRPYVGKVTDNNDPLKQGRVRCTVAGLITDGALCPWIIRRASNSWGGSTTDGQFAVPEVGSELIIEFPYKDIYAAEYTGYWNGANTTPTASTPEYPETIVFAQVDTLKVTYNKTSKDLEVSHPSGTKITIKQNGDIEVVATKDVTLNGNTGRILTTESEQVIDFISGVPCVGVARVKAGMV